LIVTANLFRRWLYIPVIVVPNWYDPILA